MTLQAKPFKPKVCKVCQCNFTPQRMAAKVAPASTGGGDAGEGGVVCEGGQGVKAYSAKVMEISK